MSWSVVQCWSALRGSLRLRLLLGTLASIVLALSLAGWSLSGLFHRHVAQQFHAELQRHLDTLAAHLALTPEGRPAVVGDLGEQRFENPYSGLYWQVERIAGETPGASRALRSRSLWDDALRIEVMLPADGEVHVFRAVGPGGTGLGAAARVVRFEDVRGDVIVLRLVVAADERQIAEPVGNFNGMLVLALGGLGGILAVAAGLQVWVALVPLRRLRQELSEVRSGRLARLEGPFPGEVEPLVADFNSVLNQNAEVVERARMQAGNLAHALKTPLSVIANTASALPGEAGQLLTGQVELARRQIDYHLRRARTAAAVRLPGVRTSMSQVVEGLVRVMRRVHAGRVLEFAVVGAPDLNFRGEAEDLQEILGNLLDNAGKWARHAVHLEYVRDGASLVLTLDDDGPGIPPAERIRVLRRGERADERVAGSGLGLAIVDELVRLYDGALELGESPQGGLRVRVILPAV